MRQHARRYVWLIACLVVASCATQAPAAPSDLVRIMNETHNRVEVRQYWGAKGNWYANSYRFVREGDEVWGNCTDFAATAAELLKEEGKPALIVKCGPRHVAVQSAFWILDSTRTLPVHISDAGCSR